MCQPTYRELKQIEANDIMIITLKENNTNKTIPCQMCGKANAVWFHFVFDSIFEPKLYAACLKDMVYVKTLIDHDIIF